MKILVINAGSSSLKYQLIDMETEQMLCKGNCERIGLDMGKFSYKTADGQSKAYDVVMNTHADAFQQVKAAIADPEMGVIKEFSEISAVGHRVVQGGALFSESVRIDEDVIAGIESLIPLAPLHNSANVQGIRACFEVFGKDVPEVAVFDTSFHSTMPEEAYMYAVPYEYYEKYSVRRYGFHGTSHRYVSDRVSEIMGKDIKDLKIISCHIGNGSSITAIDGGKVIDTTMGLTPLDGFMMGTRSGSLDPSVVTFIMDKEGLSAKEMDSVLNKKSGLLGISGISSDDRDISAAEEAGNERAALAHKMLVYQIQKNIGAYIAALGGVDVITFTAGLGENQFTLRQKICEGLKVFGVDFDVAANDGLRGKEALISTADSKVKVYVVPTNEELVIARDTKALL